MLKKNEIYTAEIDGYNSEGAGVAHIDGQAIFIPYTILGEQVTFKIIKITSKYAVGKVFEIVTPSPDRVQPECEYYQKCGGCSLLHFLFYKETNKGERLRTNTPSLLHPPL